MEDEEPTFLEQIDTIADAHPRYRRQSFLFIHSALYHTVRRLEKECLESSGSRHVTGQELSWGIADYAREQYGPLARSVFEHWGIHTTRDFGEIVYCLIDHGLMSKTSEDRLEHFDDVYKFADVFDPRTIQETCEALDLEAL